FGERQLHRLLSVPLRGPDSLKIEAGYASDGGHVGVAVRRPGPQLDRVATRVKAVQPDLQFGCQWRRGHANSELDGRLVWWAVKEPGLASDNNETAARSGRSGNHRSQIEIRSTMFRVTFRRRRSYSRVVRGSAWPARCCTSSSGTFCSSRSVTVATRNEWGENCPGSPADFSRRFIIRQMSIPLIALVVSCLVRRIAVRNRGPSVIPAAAM